MSKKESIMNYDVLAQKIYTARTKLYHLFIHVVGYARGVKKFMINGNYIQSNMRILDAGCGGGLVTKIMHHIAKKQRFTTVSFFGFDLTPAMLDYFRSWITKKNIKNISLAKIDVLKPKQLPPDWKNFDLVVVSGMLEHLPRHRIVEGIRNLKYLLKPDGTLLIFICRKNWFAYWIIKKWWKAETYTAQEMKAIMQDAGLIFSLKPFSGFYRYLNYWLHIIEGKKS